MGTRGKMLWLKVVYSGVKLTKGFKGPRLMLGGSRSYDCIHDAGTVSIQNERIMEYLRIPLVF